MINPAKKKKIHCQTLHLIQQRKNILMTPERVVGDELVGLDVDGPDQVQVVDELDEMILNLFFFVNNAAPE
jgi:hypothetical protein